MKAIVHDGYGPPEDLQLREIERPRIDVKGVLVRVRAASVNPLDWHLMRGEPSFMRMIAGTNPIGRIPGSDVAGVVEAVGARVGKFRPGDEVFGTCRSAFAEYVCSDGEHLVSKPPSLTWEQAASIPVAGCTALQAVRDHGRLRPGQRVLVNGAAGGVGTFAVQIAKQLGATVTGVCSKRNVELIRSLGADGAVDYTDEDFTRSTDQYDLIVHVAGNRTLEEMRRALTKRGTIVVVGAGTGRDENGRVGLVELASLMLRGQIASAVVRPRELMFMARVRQTDLIYIASLIEQRKLTPVIDRTYPLADVPDAIRHLETGHARGKIIITID